MRDAERTALERLTGLGGGQFARELAGLYLDQTSGRLAAARVALRQRDAITLAASAHAIRASSAQLGAQDLVSACESLEDAAESGDLASAAGRLMDVETTFQSFGTWLAEHIADGDASGVEDRGDSSPRASTQAPIIAVVEDNADNRLLIDAILGASYVLDEYVTGTEALAMMPSRPPALVLLDVSLPGLDGLEVLARMRADAVLHRIPVVAVTAHAMAGDRERYLAAGFDGYIPKPIEDERLLTDTIERILAGRAFPGAAGRSRPRDHGP